MRVIEIVMAQLIGKRGSQTVRDGAGEKLINLD